jgi:hypothetical protein
VWPHKNPTGTRFGPPPQVSHGHDDTPRHTPAPLLKWRRKRILNRQNPDSAGCQLCRSVVVRGRVELPTFRFSVGMSDIGLTVSGMTELPISYDVTVTVANDGGCGPDPSGFAVAAGQAASSRNAAVMSAHTWDKTVSIVTVEAPDRSSAVAVVSEALRRSAASSSR